ncbi:MAG: ATP-binding cassette domain-containing protein [Oscillospiraceae bacterium]|jgi:energy-coupling factor transport system ATP-binding protein|nr:ATP-binding cassette domain-containing protein [Oscillospiraceae bacterium]
MSNIVEIKQLSFKYKGSGDFALADVSLTFREGEFVGIIGASGAGKTTLLSSINGIVPHYNGGDFYGEASVCGVDTIDGGITKLSEFVGNVLDDPEAQITADTVEDETAFALENAGYPPDVIEERITAALEATGLTEFRLRDTRLLSGGQKQRTAIAAAIAAEPRVLLLDEATAELDPLGSRKVFETLSRLNKTRKMTIVAVEQKIMLLSEFVSRLIVMSGGKVVMDGETREILARHEELEALGINCPRVVTLASKLKDKGLYSADYPKTARECAEELRRINQ